MFISKTYTQLKIQFESSLNEMVKDRPLKYIAPKEVFDQSRSQDDEILNLFLESYPAFKSVLHLWLDIVSTTDMRPIVNQFDQLHVLMEYPHQLRKQEIQTIQKILTLCNRGYKEALYGQIESQALEEEDGSQVFQQVFHDFIGTEGWWADHLRTLKSDVLKVPDVAAKTNLCIRCVNEHGSIVPRPAKGQPLPRCAEQQCDQPMSYNIDSGATLIMCNRLTTAELQDAAKTKQVLDDFKLAMTKVTIASPAELLEFYAQIPTVLFNTMTRLDFNNYAVRN